MSRNSKKIEFRLFQLFLQGRLLRKSGNMQIFVLWNYPVSLSGSGFFPVGQGSRCALASHIYLRFFPHTGSFGRYPQVPRNFMADKSPIQRRRVPDASKHSLLFYCGLLFAWHAKQLCQNAPYGITDASCVLRSVLLALR